MLQYIIYLFKHKKEIKELIDAKRKELEIRELEKSKAFLNLCAKHQQRSPGTEYAEHNCDYCKVLDLLSKDEF